MASIVSSIDAVWKQFAHQIVPNTLERCEIEQKSDLLIKLEAINDPKKVIEDEMARGDRSSTNNTLTRSMLTVPVGELLPKLRTLRETNPRCMGIILFHDLLETAWERYQFLINDPITQAGKHWTRFQSDEKREYTGNQRYLNKITISTAFATKLWCEIMEIPIRNDPMNRTMMCLFEWYNTSPTAKHEQYVADGKYRYVPSPLQLIEKQKIQAQLHSIQVESSFLIKRYTTVYNYIESHLQALRLQEASDTGTASASAIDAVNTIVDIVTTSLTWIKKNHSEIANESLLNGLVLPTVKWEEMMTQIWKIITVRFMGIYNKLHHDTTTNRDVNDVNYTRAIKKELTDKYVVKYKNDLKQIEIKLQNELEDDGDYKQGDDLSHDTIQEYSQVLLIHIYHTRRMQVLTNCLAHLDAIKTNLLSCDVVFKEYPDIEKSFVSVYLKKMHETITVQLSKHTEAYNHDPTIVAKWERIRTLEYQRCLYIDVLNGLERITDTNDQITSIKMKEMINTIIQLRSGKCTRLVQLELHERFTAANPDSYNVLDSLVTPLGSRSRLLETFKSLENSISKLTTSVFPIIQTTQQQRLATTKSRTTLVSELLSYLSSTSSNSASSNGMDDLPCVDLDQRSDFIHFLYGLPPYIHFTAVKQQMDRITSTDNQWVDINPILIEDVELIKTLYSKLSSSTQVCTLRELWLVVVASWRLLIASLTSVAIPVTNSSVPIQ